MEKERILTIDIGGSAIKIKAIDRRGHFNAENDILISNTRFNNESFTSVVVKEIKNALEEKGNHIIAVCIAIPGLIDQADGIIEVMPNIPGVINLNIVEEIKKVFPYLLVYIIHDVDASLLGEKWKGSAQELNTVFMLALGSGVGSASYASGMLQRGLGKAPEWGHVPIASKEDHFECSCGQYNCLEVFVGTKGLARIYSQEFGVSFDSLSTQDIYQISYRLREKLTNDDGPPNLEDKKWLKVLDRYCQYLAAGLRNIILVHQPEAIILGGGIIHNDKTVLEKTVQKLSELNDPILYRMIQGVELRLGELIYPANIGCAWYAFDQIGKLGLNDKV